MPSGWGEYYVVILSAVLALGIPAVLYLISVLVRASQGPKKEEPLASTGEDVSDLGRRINTRFFSGTNNALVLITLLLVLIPCAGALQPISGRHVLTRGLVSILTISAFSILGLLYSAKKGDLNWLRTFRKRDS